MTREEEIRNEAKLKCNDIASEVDYKYSAAYDGFVMGAEQADKTMIDKACEWLKQNAKDYVVTCYDEGELNDEDLLNDFKKAVES